MGCFVRGRRYNVESQTSEHKVTDLPNLEEKQHRPIQGRDDHVIIGSQAGQCRAGLASPASWALTFCVDLADITQSVFIVFVQAGQTYLYNGAPGCRDD